MQKIRLVLFSKYQIVRSALRHMLAAASDLDIVAEVESLEQAEQAVHKVHPDVVLVETIETTNASIPKLAERTARNEKVSVVVLSNEGNPRLVRAMLRAGVAGYVLKQSSEAELLLAVRSAARGRKFLDASLINQIAFEGAPSDDAAPGKHPLSNRERQVLKGLVQGYTSPEIARELHLSSKTVQTYRSRIYEKLEVRSRSDLVRYAISSGLLSVNEALPE